ncbi:peptidoglycan-binding domain-containing protein [Phytoactinopolyspora mesophila]|uniref:Peptidoglycan binding-like domain-containing protein n=1 Tax=Phytoactinopolyspora mesophila TaxID=2650750 RepID=A0A7K3M9I0_9ACTN|nr:peptidoglycan-binding domain-containing protein [Phytoactinopolyspora mesophila]NDL59933.1 hypothetical protein [Phytoactinopolyspora mesophila]
MATTHAIPVVPAERQPSTHWFRRASATIRTAANAIVCLPPIRLPGAWRTPEADPGSVQRILVALGRLDAGAATGTANASTTRAVAAFQHASGLPADGVADAHTVHAMARSWHRSAMS